MSTNRAIWVWKLTGGDRWIAYCAAGCQWWGSEPTIALAGDLGRRHVVHHRAEIRPAKLPIGEKP